MYFGIIVWLQFFSFSLGWNESQYAKCTTKSNGKRWTDECGRTEINSSFQRWTGTWLRHALINFHFMFVMWKYFASGDYSVHNRFLHAHTRSPSPKPLDRPSISDGATQRLCIVRRHHHSRTHFPSSFWWQRLNWNCLFCRLLPQLYEECIDCHRIVVFIFFFFPTLFLCPSVSL